MSSDQSYETAPSPEPETVAVTLAKDKANEQDKAMVEPGEEQNSKPARRRGRPRKQQVPADTVTTTDYLFQFQTETHPNQSNFALNDLVWGKVRSHPWWPGQIYDPSLASEMALDIKKKDHYLIAYFGDKTFAWNEASDLKPYQSFFPQMEKQSGSDSFVAAVKGSLNEVSRRVESSLACSCFDDKSLKEQLIENAGIKEGSSLPIVDNSVTLSSFQPEKLFEYIQELACSPLGKVNTLDFVIARAYLKAFDRYRAFPSAPEFVYTEPFSTDSKISPNKDSGNGRKRKKSKAQIKAERTPKYAPLRRRKRKVANYTSDDPEYDPKSETRKIHSRSQIATESDDDTPKKTKSRGRPKKKTKPVTIEYSSPGEMLSQLCLAAQNPVKGHSFLSCILSFFTGYKNFTASTDSIEDKELTEKIRGTSATIKRSKRKSYTPKRMQDSYWTDVALDMNSNDESNELEKSEESDSGIGPKKKSGADNKRAKKKNETSETSPSKDNVNNSGEECEPTALVLYFNNPEAIPSESELIKIFSPYGPLRDSETEILSKTNRASVVFKKRVDAEVAFSSAGKYSVFGPALVSYELNYLKSSPKNSPAKENVESKPDEMKVDLPGNETSV